jgi:hypothetical protein
LYFPGGEREAGVVLHVLLGELGGVVFAKLHLMPSRTLPTIAPLASRICPIKSSAVIPFEPFFATSISEPGNLHDTGMK